MEAITSQHIPLLWNRIPSQKESPYEPWKKSPELSIER